MPERDRPLAIGRDLGLVLQAAGAAVGSRSVSASMIQRRVRVGFVKAGRLMDLLAQEGVISPVAHPGGRPWTRKPIVTPDGLDAALDRIRASAAKEPGADR